MVTKQEAQNIAARLNYGISFKYIRENSRYSCVITTNGNEIKFSSIKSAKRYMNTRIKERIIKDIATEFYYSWHNSPGTNTNQGFDDWWQLKKNRFEV